MIKRGLALMASVMIAQSAWALSPAPEVDAPDAAVQAVHRDFWRAFASRDLWGIGQTWDTRESTVTALMPASSTPAIGWQPVSDSFRRAFAHNRDIKVNVQVLQSQQVGEWGWVIAAVKFEAIQTQTGQRVKMDRMFVTEIMHKRGADWKIVHYHAHFPGFDVPGLEPQMSNVISVPIKVRSGSPQPEDDEIWKLQERFRAALQKKSAHEMAELFARTTPIVLLPKSPFPFLGADKVASGWKRSFDEIDQIQLEANHSILGGDGKDLAWAMEYGTLEMVLSGTTYQVLYFPVMTTFIFRKEADGWRIALYHSHLAVFDDGHAH
jgi:ketosteroid isomerase-like protein